MDKHSVLEFYNIVKNEIDSVKRFIIDDEK